MKKIFYIFCFIVFAFTLTACGQPVLMDQLNKQGVYPYTDSYFGFNLPLPGMFQYYQTQRLSFTGYSELDIFVPTADRNYPEMVSGYAEPVIVRVYDKTAYDSLSPAAKTQSTKVAARGDKVYTMIFWSSVPTDFTDKWSDAVEQQLIKNFKLK
jgi:hypothetical protein